MEKENKVAAIKSLLEILNDPLVVIDVGVRWGFQEHWKRLEPLVKLIGVDADEQEIDELRQSTSSDELIPKVLGASSGYGNLYITRNPACSSLYHPNENLIRMRPGMDDTSLVSTRTVEISTLDDWSAKRAIAKTDFIKLDVQGAELDVLRGSQKLLQSVRALEIEVQFNPLYQGVPLFGDVDQFLRQRGFTLWRIRNLSHYHVAGTKKEATTDEIVNYDAFPVKFKGRGGQLFWADAFYVHNEMAYESSCPWETALKDSCIAGILGFEDLHVRSLRKALAACPEDVAQRLRGSFAIDDPILSWIEKSEEPNAISDPRGVEYEIIETEILRQLEANLNHIRAERDQALQQIEALYNSHSYKIAAPFRMAADFLRKLFRKI